MVSCWVFLYYINSRFWGLVGSEVRERKGIVVVDIILCVRYVFLGYEYIDGLYFVLSFKVF